MGNCESCDRICRFYQDPEAINTVDTLNIPMNAQESGIEPVLGMSENMRDLKRGDPTMVSMTNRQLEIPIEESGLSEIDDRFYTVGSFGPGPTQNLLVRLLKINAKSNLERLIVLAKTSSLKKPHTVDKPVVTDTAHVFTLNDGKPSSIAMELHPVDADKDVVELTDRLNHDLDRALDHKKQHITDGEKDVHLTVQEIDEIIKRALQKGSSKLLDSERVGETNPTPKSQDHSEDVGCKKKKKDKEDSDEYYSIQPMHYGGIYREADSSEEQGLTDRTIVNEMPKSISSRNGGLGEEPEDDLEDSENLRKKKKGKGGKKHHLTDSDNNLDDFVGAEHDDHESGKEVLHVNQDSKDAPMTSDSHTSEAGKVIDHNTQDGKQSSKEDDSKESAENDKERHKGKKGKKKGKKNKKGGHDYYGGYRDADKDSEAVGDALPEHPEDTDARARSNYDGPMNHQPMHTQTQGQQYPAPNQQYPTPIQQYQPQNQHYQPQQYNQPDHQHQPEEPHQYAPPALPDSYQPDRGYDEQEDNYQSGESYYYDNSSEEGYEQDEGYDGQEYQGEEEQYEEEGDLQEQGYYHDAESEYHQQPDPQSYQEQPQMPQHQQPYAPSQQPPPQHQEGHQAMYQQPPQHIEQQYNHQQENQPQPEQYKPQPYPQAQNPVYNHPAPPVEQGTYIPKKPQYNDEPKMLPTNPEEKKQYPISQGQEENMAYQEEEDEQSDDGRYEEEEQDEGYGDAAQQEIIIPGLNADEDYMVGKAKSKIEDQTNPDPSKVINKLTDQYSKILREDLTQGVKLANKTAEAINKRINKIIEDSKNLSDKERMAQLDEIESAIDNIDPDPVVGDNLKQFQARFHKPEDDSTDQTVGAVLANEHGTLKAVKTPLLDSKHLVEQIAEPIIGMANIPSESKSPPFVDPKAMIHQLEIAKMMRGRNPEQAGCKHEEDSSEEYHPSGYNGRENTESRKEEEDNEQEVENKSPQITEEDTVGCKKKKKDKGSEEEYIMVYPQHSYGYRENEPNSDRNMKPAGAESDNVDEAHHGEEEVGCKKKKKDKESEEEIIYVHPPPHYNNYGNHGEYRENEEDSDRKVNPQDSNQPPEDDTVGCKKKKKDKESEEEIIYVHPPAYNNYGGYYRENEEDSDRKTPIAIQPASSLTNEAIEDKIVGLEQPGPSGPFTDEPIDENAEDDALLGCKKKKKKKDKDSGEEYVYVYSQQPHYNDYGGYRENENGADRKKPLDKVKEVIKEIVHPETFAKAKKDDDSVVQKVSQHKEDATELPKAILPALIEGIKQLRNRHNQEEAKEDKKQVETVTEVAKQTIVAPPSNKEAFVPATTINRPIAPEVEANAPPQQFNRPMIPLPQQQQFMRPPPNFGQNMRSPIEDNLAMLEAFHNQQNAFEHPQQQQQFFPRANERVGAPQPLLDNQNNMNQHHHHHKDVNFGKMIPAEPKFTDKIHDVESREVNEKTQMFFVGDGIKLPIHVKKQKDGTMHLSIDVGKLCKCNNVTCTHAVEGLANLVPTLEKLNHGKVELEVNEDSFNSALNNLNNMEHGSQAHVNENTDKSKRSPKTHQIVTKTDGKDNKEVPEDLNELNNSDSGELVPVFDDEKYDEISPIKKYYTGDLANDLVNLKDNIKKYYENEDNFKEYMSEHQRNKGFFDEFITRRVELLTNVLSWMKSIAIDEAKEQHHMDE